MGNSHSYCSSTRGADMVRVVDTEECPIYAYESYTRMMTRLIPTAVICKTWCSTSRGYRVSRREVSWARGDYLGTWAPGRCKHTNPALEYIPVNENSTSHHHIIT